MLPVASLPRRVWEAELAVKHQVLAWLLKLDLSRAQNGRGGSWLEAEPVEVPEERVETLSGHMLHIPMHYQQG